jgi:hypothetical protein
VIGASVQKFVEGYFHLKVLGASRIKGVSQPLEVFEGFIHPSSLKRASLSAGTR